MRVACGSAAEDVKLWTAEETANVNATVAIDSALNSFYGHHLPWAQYLVARGPGGGGNRLGEWRADEGNVRADEAGPEDVAHWVRLRKTQARTGQIHLAPTSGRRGNSAARFCR